MSNLRLTGVLSCLLLLVPLAFSHGAQPAAKRTFRAGAAASNITPPLGELIVGGWKPYPAKHIHDELFAKCLVLDDGKTQIAIVLCDNVGIPREVFDAAKTLIRKETGLPPSHVLTAATHTHSATTARGLNSLVPDGKLTAYQQFLARRIADGVRRAINNLEPARIGWGRAEEKSQVFNRRWHVTNKALLRNPFGGVDTVRMNPPRGDKSLLRPAGPVDPEIAFLAVESLEARPRPLGPSFSRAPKIHREEFRPIALLANYSLHYVGGVGPGHVSADYFGVFANRIAELLKAEKTDPPFVGILSNGTSGDINNINFRERGERKKPYEKMREVGRLVAQRVYDAQKSVKFHDWVPLGAMQKDLALHVRKPTGERLRYFENVLTDKTRKPYYVHERIYADRVKQLANSPDTVSVPLQALRIGDVGIAAIPFEVFVEIGLEIKQKSPLKRSFTIELANGSYGYLPTPAQHKLGGYETWMGTNRVEKTASDKIAKTVLGMLSDLRNVPEATSQSAPVKAQKPRKNPLIGTWILTKEEWRYPGERTSEYTGPLRGRLVITETTGRYERAFDDGERLVSSYSQVVDPATSPKKFDAIFSGETPIRKLRGIYRIDGDKLIRYYSQPGEPRPSSFTTFPKVGISIYTEWKRGR